MKSADERAKAAKYMKEYNARNRESVNAKRRERMSPDKYKAGNVRKYGITLEQYKSMWEAQAGLCAICSRPETRIMKGGKLASLSIDHNHITNAVRGLLCSKCNFGIGNFEENPSALLNAVQYLARYK